MKYNKNRLILILFGLALTIFIVILYTYPPSILKTLNLKVYDIIIDQIHKSETHKNVLIVDIDEKSLDEYGQWPWPRYRVANLLGKIEKAGASAIGVDILFAEKDRTSPQVLQNQLRRDLNINFRFKGLPQKLMDNDLFLAKTLKKGPYSLGYVFNFSSESGIKATRLPKAKSFIVKRTSDASSDISPVPKASSAIMPISKILKKAPSTGFINNTPDPDGVTRRIPLVSSYKNHLYPHLALSTLFKALMHKNSHPVLFIDKNGVRSISYNKIHIPLDSKARMLIHYKGPSQTIRQISASKILRDQHRPQLLKNKIVFVGSTAAGLKDITTTPLDSVFPGVEVLATVVDNILSRDIFHKPDWAFSFESLATLLFGISITLLIAYIKATWVLPIIVLMGVSVWSGSLLSLEEYNIYISPFYPLFTLLVTFSLLSCGRYWIMEKEKRYLRNAFSKYVSPKIVNQIANSPEMLSLQGEDKEVCILFSDIRDFTTLSEQLPPAELTSLLHDYFTPVTRIITQKEGTLDKFIGDALMAFWNAPLQINNYKERSIESALSILSTLDELNFEFQDKYGINIQIGIGLHAGICRVGNMGSADLFDYTLIGDNVNITSRLEGLCKLYGVRLILSSNLLQACPKDYLLQELDLVKVKGRNEPIQIYTLHEKNNSSEEKLVQELKMYEKSLNLYRNKFFTDAYNLFEELNRRYTRRKLYELYLSRCEKFIEHPPPMDWDGAFDQQEK